MTLYRQLGGEPTLAIVVPDFFDRVIDDPLLAPWFAEIDLERLIEHQKAYLAVILGGPELYTGRSMRVAHAGLGITSEAYDRLVGHLVAALDAAAVDTRVVASMKAQVESLKPAIV